MSANFPSDYPKRINFCIEGRLSLQQIDSIEEGVSRIESLLRRPILCTHDIQDMEVVYKKIDQLERQVEEIPRINSHQVLGKIIRKIEHLRGKIEQDPQGADLISLYRLEQFFEKRCAPFSEKSSSFSKEPVYDLGLATDLPYCGSESQLNQDIQSFIAAPSSEEVKYILDHKRNKIKDFHQRLKDIKELKIELQEHRLSNPSLHPSYLDELLERGHLHLYRHLISMSKLKNREARTQAIEQTHSFSDLSHIVIQTRNAIIEKVVGAIPSHLLNIVFLLGSSGSGKSTTLCYLRGDKLILQNHRYEPTKDKTLVGLETTVSCTFLPNVEIINEWAIIDFAGFEDSHGELVSIGMEFALKALIQKFQPTILVLESITSLAEGRGSEIAKLAKRLDRLLENKKDCILGITKYSLDVDYQDMEILKEKELRERKEKLAETEEEKDYRADIRLLLKKKPENYEKEVREIEAKLEHLRALREQQAQANIPETAESISCREKIEKKEQAILQELGLQHFIPFSQLDKPTHLQPRLKKLSEIRNSVRPRLKNILDSGLERLLKQQWKTNLKPQLIQSNENLYVKFKDPSFFQNEVLNAGLLNTILAESYPEIGEFLDLPEMDPQLRKEFEKEIVQNCIQNYIEHVLSQFDWKKIEETKNDVQGKVSSAALENLDRHWKTLTDYVIGLFGNPGKNGRLNAKEAWKEIAEFYRSKVQEKYQEPQWLKVCKYIPFAIPVLKRISFAGIESQMNFEETIQELCQKLESTYLTLVNLKHLEIIIQKEEHINQALCSVSLSFHSRDVLVRTSLSKIAKIRSAYGEKDWDDRISILQNSSIYKAVDKQIDIEEAIGYVAKLLEEEVDLIVIKTPPNLSELISSIKMENLLQLSKSNTFILLSRDKSKLNAVLTSCNMIAKMGKEMRKNPKVYEHAIMKGSFFKLSVRKHLAAAVVLEKQATIICSLNKIIHALVVLGGEYENNLEGIFSENDLLLLDDLIDSSSVILRNSKRKVERMRPGRFLFDKGFLEISMHANKVLEDMISILSILAYNSSIPTIMMEKVQQEWDLNDLNLECSRFFHEFGIEFSINQPLFFNLKSHDDKPLSRAMRAAAILGGKGFKVESE